jgi:hypothetical protein
MSARKDPEQDQADSEAGEPSSSSPREYLCRNCMDTRQCLICAGTGLWSQGTFEEEECSACYGTGHCPD